MLHRLWFVTVDAFHTNSLGAYEWRGLTIGWVALVVGLAAHTIWKKVQG